MRTKNWRKCLGYDFIISMISLSVICKYDLGKVEVDHADWIQLQAERWHIRETGQTLHLVKKKKKTILCLGVDLSSIGERLWVKSLGQNVQRNGSEYSTIY